MAKEFTASIDEWVLKVEGLLEAVFHQSVQDTIEIMQHPVAKGGNMPVRTGFLRNSLRVTIGGPATGMLDRPAEYNFPDNEDRSYVMTIAGAPLEQSIYAVYLAKYAGSQEYGSGGREGKHFRSLAAQRWQQTVAKNVASLRKQ